MLPIFRIVLRGWSGAYGRIAVPRVDRMGLGRGPDIVQTAILVLKDAWAMIDKIKLATVWSVFGHFLCSKFSLNYSWRGTTRASSNVNSDAAYPGCGRGNLMAPISGNSPC